MKFISFILAFALSACGTSKQEDLKTPDQTPIPPSTIDQTPKIKESKPNRMTVISRWHTEVGKVYKDNKEIQLRGINWFGFETPELIVHGLWTGRSMDSYLKQVSDLGFNALRLPLAPEVFEDGYKSTQGKTKPLDNLKDLLTIANNNGIYVLLDLHTCNFKQGLMGSPLACDNYRLSSWFTTLEKMARLSLEHPNVFGIDLYNEPYKLSWKDWRNLSSEAASHVLAINPKLLIFIEGVANQDTDNAGYGANWGGNLVEASSNLPNVPKSQLVFSPHTYGPSVAHQTYFDDPSFPKNMPKIWDAHFGYLTQKGFTVSLGEFGGRYKDKDQIWQDALIKYLIQKDMKNFFYWSLNPNSGDTGGLLNDDWTTVNKGKLDLLKKLF